MAKPPPETRAPRRPDAAVAPPPVEAPETVAAPGPRAPGRAAVVRRTLRLAILGSRGIPARYGGFESFAEELSTRMAENGHRVTVFCERTGGARRAEHRGVRLRRLRTWPLGPGRTLAYDAAAVLECRRGFDAIL
ncbi:MAG TPA: DUF1972 domain-containing protein, partial [bacterium]|nr:DUF1972 domain-containing protein [bacterium]